MSFKHRVMIVEDEYIIAKDIQEMLHELGYVVSAVTDTGADAVPIARKNHPDIILMDIKLKGNTDGIEAAKLIHEYCNIPIIYMTALVDDRTLQRAKMSEPSGYILKPVKKNELHTMIEMALYKHKIENYLKDREELLSTTLKSISDGVITTNEKCAITFMNPTAETMLGCSQEEAVGKPFDSILKVIEENTEKEIDNPIKKIIEGKKKVEYENHILVSNYNRRISIAMTVSLVNDDKGETSGTIIIIKDVTRQRRLQEELMKAQKLESLASLAGTIGHEFNNLLTVIMGNIALIKQGGEIKGEALNDIEEVELAAQKAKDLAKKLLSFSRRGEPVKKIAPLMPIIKASLQSLAQTTSIHCDASISPHLWQAEIDESQISQVISNVIKKAYQISGKHGIIKVNAGNVIVGDDTKLPLKPGAYVRIEIHEFDTSIPNKEIKTVFDLKITEDGKFSESEMELTSSYSIIRNHGGYIAAESGANKGTMFSIYLPAKQVEVVEEEKPAPVKKISNKKRVLVMDDQQLVRIIAGKILNHFGFEVEFAQAGGEALEKYKEAMDNSNPFDCMILDLTVEFGMGGIETIEKILEIDPAAKAIVSTGYSNDPIKFTYQGYGFKGVIMKPYEFSEINKTVHDVLNGD